MCTMSHFTVCKYLLLSDMNESNYKTLDENLVEVRTSHFLGNALSQTFCKYVSDIKKKKRLFGFT